jgi:Fe-S cluster biogenesis protein NfuA
MQPDPEPTEAKREVPPTPVAVSAVKSGMTTGGAAATAPDRAGMPIDQAERARREAALEELMALMRPAVQADGGDLVVTSVDYEAGIVSVELQGACGSCAISSLTLQGGVERLLKQRLDWVTEVVGEVDESMDIFESVALGRGGYVPKA